MGDRDGLSGGIGRIFCGAWDISGRRIGIVSVPTGLSHGNFAASPCIALLNGMPRSAISGLRLLEEMQNMLRTRACPYRKEVVVGVAQCAASTKSDQSRIAGLSENHTDR